ncbi:DAK2 domain-containing protein, partial [Pengzhenrongella sp.]|uniref:DAK2 domain-containing protein n=1 Tax=Pengzhenrongella sp. TaxID=2888820 RepID=UPI002F91E841
MQRLDGEAVRAWVQAATTALDAARGALDSLNVFPVPDADTGTNLYLTLAQGADEVAALDAAAPAAELLAAFAHGALVGARGNSGVIASQFLLGLARGFDDGAVPDGVGLARALDGAQRAARTAVARPVDGTILTA